MNAVVARARAAIGCRFRRQGRDPADGFDCVGLVGRACGVVVPGDYPGRSGDAARAGAALAAAGDVLLLASGPGQLHLAIWTGDGIVHADAVARRVVERPGAPPGAIIGIWRI